METDIWLPVISMTNNKILPIKYRDSPGGFAAGAVSVFYKKDFVNQAFLPFLETAVITPSAAAERSMIMV